MNFKKLFKNLCKALLVAGVASFAMSVGAAPSAFLKTSGVNIRNNNGQGDVVPLRGANLGSWLLRESWMSPLDSSGLVDDYSVLQTLNSRFGVATQESLVKTYQEAWLTTNDLDNIRALGMNCVRLPFWWGNVQRLDGSWRTDAFDKMDWLVTNAWQRGIYTVIDFHGVPGGQSTSQSTAQANQNQYWTTPAFQTQTTLIWSNVAAHFAGNPAVAGYDLINEPFGAPSQTAIWNAYSNLYQTIRGVDPDHIIIMEGCWSGTGTNGQSLNWQWDVLPRPSLYGWTNVVYSMHAYAGSTTASAEKAETDKQVSDFNNHQSWNTPCYIGEFNSHGTQSAWRYSILQYNQNNMNWANWSYKATAGSVGNSWGVYDPTGTWPPTPNIQTNSASSISNSWSQWKTSTAFGITPFLKQYLGAPIAIGDFYTNISGALIINSNAGVLFNDQDTNLNVSGISLSAVLVSSPTNGVLNLSTNGSFTYTPFAGFSGSDTFRYRVFDGYVNSANIANVSIMTVSNLAAGPVTQLIWSTQPDLATNSQPFAQQPILQTADALGNPSTNGLPASLLVTVTRSAGAGVLSGTTNFDIGLSAGKGVMIFSNLQINTAGVSNQLTASTSPSLAVSRLANGNFNSPNSTAAPTSWTVWTYGGGYANHEIISPAPAVLGNYDGTYQMTCGAANISGGGGCYQTLSASAGLIYTLTISSGVQNWWWPSGEMRLFFFDASLNGLVTNVLSVTGGISGSDVGKPCQQYQLSVVAPAGTAQAKIEFAGFGGGSVWFDNAVLMESNSIPAVASTSTLPFTVYPAIPTSQTNYIAGIANNGDGTFTVAFIGTAGAQYCVQTTTSLVPPVVWETLPGSTNTASSPDGTWVCAVTNTGAQQFYRSAVVLP